MLRDATAGEELCISYIEIEDAYDVRREILQKHYLFTCGCLRCCSKDADEVSDILKQLCPVKGCAGFLGLIDGRKICNGCGLVTESNVVP